MISFLNFYKALYTEAKVPLDKRRSIRKKFRKLYKKDFKELTFGFDIEFGPYTSINYEFDLEDVDYYLHQDFINQHLDNKAYDDYFDEMSTNQPNVNNLLEEWEEEHPEPEEEDYESEDEYYVALSAWQDEKDQKESDLEVESHDWEPDTSFEDWLPDNWTTYFDYDYLLELEEMIMNSDPSMIYAESIVESLESKLFNYPYSFDRDIISKIETDAATDVEITSSILKIEDLPRVKELFEVLEDMDLNTASNTSCHIHVGYAKNWSMISTLSLFNLVDEEELVHIIGRQSEHLSEFAELNDVIKDARIMPVLNNIKKIGKVYFGKREKEDAKLMMTFFDDAHFSTMSDDVKKRYTVKKIKNNVLDLNEEEFFAFVDGLHILNHKYQGVNVSNDHIEFRYPSSQMMSNHVEILQLVDYFMLLSEIAAKKERVVFANKTNKTIIHKLPNNNFRIKFVK